mgnify:CR=1 FL=1
MRRSVLALALPMILSNLTVPLVGLVDTAVLGRLPTPEPLAAAAVGAMLFSLAFWALNFLRMSTTGLVAQAYGRGELAIAARVGSQGVALAVALALLVLVLYRPLVGLALALISVEPEVAQAARAYLDARVLAAPAVLVNFVLIGVLLGLQDARSALVIMVAVNGTNIVLSPLFVLGFGWGAAGVGAASAIAEWSGLAVGLDLVRRRLRPHWHGRSILEALRHGDALGRLLSVNADLFLRTIALLSAFALLTAVGARLGTVVVAANAVLLNLQSLLSYALDGFAHAAEALVGRALGDRNLQGLRQVLWATAAWSLGFATVLMVVFATAGPSLLGVLTTQPEVLAVATTHLPWMIAMPWIAVWSFWLDGVFVGATQARAMRKAMLLALFGVYVPALALVVPFANHGLWAAFTLFMVARAAALARYLWRPGLLAPDGSPRIPTATGDATRRGGHDSSSRKQDV